MSNKLVYMDLVWARALRITGAPKGKAKLIGTYVADDLSLEPHFLQSKLYTETQESMQRMKEDRAKLKLQHYDTEVLRVSMETTAVSIGDGDFDGDSILFYYTGINEDGEQVFLKECAGPDNKTVMKFVTAESGGANKTTLIRGEVDIKVDRKIRALAKKSNIHNLVVGRLYR